MKKFKTSKQSFIGSYYIDTKICDDIVDTFLNVSDKYKNPGETYKGESFLNIDKNMKDSLDFNINKGTGLFPFNRYDDALQKCLEKYIKTYDVLNWQPHFNVREKMNVQYYKPGGGFKKWHYERMNHKTLKRNLVFMTYLNDVPDGGTDFLYQKITTPAQKGLTLIWPSDWTHTHKSQISKTSEKFIITGWYSYE